MTPSHKPLEEQLTALANDLAKRGTPEHVQCVLKLTETVFAEYDQWDRDEVTGLVSYG